MRSLRLTLFAGILALGCPPAHASLDAALNGMMFQVTTPGVYESQSRYGFVGGSLGIRTPIKNVNLINIAVPTIRTGCGGIDMFFGSFSAISGEEFKQLIRAIGQNAAGYALYVALDSMCAPCLAILNELRDLMQKLNSSKLNSCEVAKGAVDWIHDVTKHGEVQKDTATFTSTIKGYFTGWYEGAMKRYENEREAIREAGPENPYYGNLVWRALFESESPNKIGNPDLGIGSTIDTDIAQILMSITGTIVYPKAEEAPTQGCVAGDNDPSKCEDKPQLFFPILDLNDLIEGPQDRNKRVYVCEDGTQDALACTQMTTAPYTFIGTNSWVKQHLFGTPNPERDNVQSGSFISNVAEGRPLTSQQKALLTRYPFFAAMKRVRRSEGALWTIGISAADVISTDLAFELVSAMHAALGEAFTAQGVSAPPQWDQQMRKFEVFLTELAQERRKTIEDTVRLYEYVEIVSDSLATPSFHTEAFHN